MMYGSLIGNHGFNIGSLFHALILATYLDHLLFSRRTQRHDILHPSLSLAGSLFNDRCFNTLHLQIG